MSDNIIQLNHELIHNESKNLRTYKPQQVNKNIKHLEFNSIEEPYKAEKQDDKPRNRKRVNLANIKK